MLSRGPDGASTWLHENILLGHRRLAVRAPGDAGAQPKISADGRWAIVFNGELYEDEELRAVLAGEGRAPHEAGDTATVLAMFATFGFEAFSRLRGMFALAVVDIREQRLWLARDPFGMKPLYYWTDGDELVFASTPTAVLEHPRVPVHPDLQMVSAYLTTLRPELEGRTMFRDLHRIEPGEVLEFDLEQCLSSPRSRRVGYPARTFDPRIELEAAAELLRETLAESVERHLVADVPVACLLSGGLDSTGIAALSQEHANLATYCAGTPGTQPGDMEFARLAADELGLAHSQVVLDATSFDSGWSELVESTGFPLSTPNEVAILQVCRALRADGHVVALSGEGADEILGGYEGIMQAAYQFEHGPSGPLDGGRLHLEIASWIPSATKPEVLRRDHDEAIDNDRFLIESYGRAFADAAAETPADADPLEAHLRFLRRTNLAGLLGRLDRASMCAGVEGRTPFSDREVAALAESLPVALKLGNSARGPEGPRGKHVLRHALADLVPASIIERPKASFPLPFQGWLEPAAQAACSSEFARDLFQPELLELVSREPAQNWSYAWPILNICRWGEHWWPSAVSTLEPGALAR